MKIIIVMALLSLLPPGAAAADFNACLKALRGEAAARGVTAQTFDRALAGFEPDPAVIEAMGSQPEFTTPIWDYLAGLVDEQRVADGRVRIESQAKVDADIESKFGVDGTVPLAIGGI